MLHNVISLGLTTAIICPVIAENLKPVQALVSRVTPKAADQVVFQIDKNIKGFSLENKNGKLLIKAPTPINLAAAYGYFLRNFQKAHWSWNGDRMPQSINPELLKEPVLIDQIWDWRFAYNYCTLSYTSAFWGPKEWEKEIDRLALHGVTHPLIQAGLEKVWQLTLKELGYPDDKTIKFIPNPASAAWWNMGNLEGHGGPLTQNMIDQEAKLGSMLVDRMRSLGMTPVLQGFVGLVPHDLGEFYKEGDVRYVDQGQWVSGFVRPAVLDPTTKAYEKVAEIWFKNLHKVYGGKAGAYGGDLFHEGGKSGGINVTAAAAAVQTAMQKASPGSTWIIQAWGGNPSKALLDGLDKEKVQVLALTRDMKNGTNGEGQNGYHGFPWIWCELLNFGGNHNLYGGLEMLGNLGNLQKSPDKDNIKGLGLLSEGTETNPIFYELFFQRFWMPKDLTMSKEKLHQWIESYAVNRYGSAPEEVMDGLKKLEASVYSPTIQQEGCTESILCARPGRNVQKASSWATGAVYYNIADVQAAAEDFVKAAEAHPELMKQETFRYDLIDIVRQYLADTARPLLAATMAAYDAGDQANYDRLSGQFLALISDSDKLLASYPQWRFGEMYERAQAKGKTAEEKRNMEVACKQLVTTWSGKIDALNDYSNRQLGGLMKDFYLPRWKFFFDAYGQALEGTLEKSKVDQEFRDKVHQFETAWSQEATPYTSKPEGNTLAIAQGIMKKFAPLSKELASLAKQMQGTKWSLRDGDKQFVFEVSDVIHSSGNYIATFLWEDGDSALKIKKVALYEGDKLVSEDVHEGQTGWENKNNSYKLPVKELRKGLESYTIKADVEGVSGNNSGGKFTFLKAGK